MSEMNRRVLLGEGVSQQIATLLSGTVVNDLLFDHNKHITGTKIEECIVFNPKKVLLVSSYGILSEEGENTTTPSYGVRNIASYIHSIRSDTVAHVLDPNFVDTEETIEKYLGNQTYDIIGLSAIPANIGNDLRLLSLLKRKNPNAKIIIGGVQSHSLESYKLQEYIGIDALVVGNGYEAFNDLLDEKVELGGGRVLNYRNKKNVNTANIEHIYPSSNDSDIIHNRLDRIDTNQNTLYLKISNACKGVCYWCVSPKDISRYETTSQFRNELTMLDSLHNISSIVFQDNDISFSKSFYIQLHQDSFNYDSDQIEGQFIAIPKFGKSRIEEMDDELLTSLEGLNFKRIAYGIESFDQNARKGLQKYYSDAEYEDILESTIRHNIVPEINLILFNPYDTLDTLHKTMKESQKRLEKGGIMFITFGLYAVPKGRNTIFGDDSDVEFKDHFYPGMKAVMKVPYRHKSAPSLQEIFVSVESRYLSLVAIHKKMLQQTPTVPYKNILKLIALGKVIGSDVTFYERFLIANTEKLLNYKNI